VIDVPSEIRVRGRGQVLAIRFADADYSLAAELLRVESPSAEVKGHGPGEEQLVAGKRHVRIANVEPVGTYAVRIIFDDGHATGLYTFAYLKTLAQTQAQVFAAYEAKLAEAGLTR
jgi:DUF971 family protein